MSSPGRPSIEAEDFPLLVDMDERWCGGHGELSVRKISRIVTGLEPASSCAKAKYSCVDDANMKPQPSSVAKRLERRFLKLVESGEALALSVNRVCHQEQTILASKFSKKSSDWIEREAIRLTAARCVLAIKDVVPLLKQGDVLLLR